MTKKKLLGSAIMLLVGIYPGLFVAYNAHYALTGVRELEINPITLAAGLLREQKILTFFGLFMLALLAFLGWVLTSSMTLNYKSGMRQIAPGIYTPLPCGENQHGSARWLKPEEYKSAFSVARLHKKSEVARWLAAAGAMDLSEDYTELDDEIYDTAPFASGGVVVGQTKNGKLLYTIAEDTHSMTLGATRSSKTRTVVIQSACVTALAGESMIFSDPKGELYFDTAPFLRRLGYEVIAIDFENPQKSSCYNFMQPIIDFLEQRDIPNAQQTTWELVEALVGESKGEPIWHNGECSIIACCIMAVAYDNMNSPQYQNLSNVFHFISRMCAPKEDGGVPLNEYLRELPDSHPAKSLAGISEVAHFRTRSSFYASALATLRLFENSYIADMTSRTDFDIYETGNTKRAIFIILPDEKQAYYSVASLFVYQHYQTLVGVAKKHGGRLPRRVEFFLDEIGNFAYIPHFETLLTVGGGRGIRFHLFLQAIQQLDKVYGREVSAIIRSNCETWIYLQSDEIQMLEELSKKLGNYTTKSPNLSASTHGSGGSASYSLMSRNLLTPEEIKHIQRPYQLVLSRKDPAILYAPDLSRTIFNQFLGMGDKAHNIQLQMIRNERRHERTIGAPKLWGIWHKYETPQMREPAMPEKKQSYSNLNY